MNWQLHKFEFLDMDAKREPLGDIIVSDYEVIIDGLLILGRFQLAGFAPELGKYADTYARVHFEARERRTASQLDDWHAWRAS